MDKVECVARALCIEDGDDPDKMYMTSERTTSGNAIMFSLNEGFREEENWRKRIKEAQRFVAALRAFNGAT